MSNTNCDLKHISEQHKPHCQHFVIRKKRYCRMSVKLGLNYCGEHEPKSEISNQSSDSRLRITCPFDSKHTCFANKLQKHLQKCNAKFDTTIPYLVKNINVGYSEEEETDHKNRQLINVPVEHILDVIKKVNKLYTDIIEKSITEKILYHPQLSEELQNTEYGPTTRKHLLQTSSLLGHLDQINLFQPEICFIEFGAGRGQLSYWVAKAVSNIPNTSIVLVERASLRHKLDNKLDKEKNKIFRLRADIADLVLHKIDTVQICKKVVGITKHLCGEATDLALRCLMNSTNTNVTITGIVMAFCCHHRCFWPSYTGKQFFQSNHLTKEDFDVICGLVSWATCGTGQSRSKQNNEHNLNYDCNEIQPRSSRDEAIGLSREEREIVGKKCKLVIDYGRFLYLQERKYICNLYYYIQQQISLENVCIVAYT